MKKLLGLKANFDSKAEALYIHVSEGWIARTVSFGELVNLDLNKRGQLLGIEIVGITSTMIPKDEE